MEIIFKKEMNTRNNAIKFELLRLDAYGLTSKEENANSLYLNNIVDMEYMVVGLYLDNELVAGAYISDFANTIFVEQLFVKKDFQEKGLKLGRLLLLHILNEKELFNDFFKKDYDRSRLFYINDKARAVYESVGYEECDKKVPIMEKHLKKER